MRWLSIAFDSLAVPREGTAAAGSRLAAAAATLVELAGADAVRIGVTESLCPVRESDVVDLRRACRVLELRMAPSPTLLKVALEGRPDRVVLAGEPAGGWADTPPLGPERFRSDVPPVARALHEAGIRVAARVAVPLDSIKAVHGAGLEGVELYTGAFLDLPSRDRAHALERLGDAARLAAKLRLEVGVEGRLHAGCVGTVLEAAPAVQRVAVGRGLVERALLVGLDRAVRDLRARVG